MTGFISSKDHCNPATAIIDNKMYSIMNFAWAETAAPEAAKEHHLAKEHHFFIKFHYVLSFDFT